MNGRRGLKTRTPANCRDRPGQSSPSDSQSIRSRMSAPQGAITALFPILPRTIGGELYGWRPIQARGQRAKYFGPPGIWMRPPSYSGESVNSHVRCRRQFRPEFRENAQSNTRPPDVGVDISQGKTLPVVQPSHSAAQRFHPTPFYTKPERPS